MSDAGVLPLSCGVVDCAPRVRQYLEGRFSADAGNLVVSRLSGDASTRRYLRVRRARESWVLAVYPESFDAQELSFLGVHRLLHAWSQPVPELLDWDGDRGVVLIEDLGDVTLQQRLNTAGVLEREELYRRAIEQLVRLQQQAGRERQAAACFGLAFDVEKLSWELSFFVKHFLEGLRECRLTASERDGLSEGFRTLCAEIAGWPRVLCHRDYHSRNLMWRAGELWWIDYQDARMGPATYDVASLLRDSYVDLDEQFVAQRLEEYRRVVAPEESPASFVRRFELTCVQRNLKALGTFGYQAQERGKPEYLEYVPRTLGYVHQNLGRHPELESIGSILGCHLEELRLR